MLKAKFELIRRLIERAQYVEQDETGQGGVYIGSGALVVIVVVILLIMLL